MAYSSYQEAANDVLRKPSALFIIRQDCCSLTCGESPCEAAGPPWCYYTRPTCLDEDQYSKTTKDYRFSLNAGPVCENALPLIKTIKYVPCILDVKNFKTVRGSLVVTLYDDDPLPLANPDKSVSNAETAGTFCKNWIARNENYEGRIAELWLGFEGLDESKWKLEYRGVIDAIADNKKGEVKVTVKDLLRKLDADSHATQSDENVLTAAYSGGSEIEVYDAYEFPEPKGNYWYAGAEIVRIGDDRYARYTGRDLNNNKLTGAAWVYGSNGTADAGVSVRGAIIYGVDDYGLDDGIPPDYIFHDLLFRAGVETDQIEYTDEGITLTAGIDDDDAALPVSSAMVPGEGIARIGDELIRWRGISSSELAVVERGAFGTTAASHSADDPVLLSVFTCEMNQWVAGMLMRRVISDPVEIQELIEGLCMSSTFMIWQNGDQVLTGEALTPPWWDETIQEFLDADSQNIMFKSTKRDGNEKQRLTRVKMWYSPKVNEPGDSKDDWDKSWSYVDAEHEAEDWFDGEKPETMKGAYIYRWNEADSQSGRRLSLFSLPSPILEFQMDVKDSLAVGELFRIKTRDIVNFDGTPKECTMQVLERRVKSGGAVAYECRVVNLDHRFGVIGPAYMTLADDVTDSQTSIQCVYSADTFGPDDLAAPGQFGVEDEIVDYADFTVDDDTHLTFTGCARDGDKAAHTAGTFMVPLYTGASEECRRKYGFIGDEDNDLETNEEGYVIF